MKEQNYLDCLVGVFGHPAAENPGVVIQEAAFRDMGLPLWRFLTIDVDPDKLEDAIKGLKAFKMRGINCTIPHKLNVIQYLDELSESARSIVEGWRNYPALRSDRAIQIFKRLRPTLLKSLGRAANPDEALLALDGFLAGLPAGVQLFSLFEANPHSHEAVRQYRQMLNLAAAGDIDLLCRRAQWWWEDGADGAS